MKINVQWDIFKEIPLFMVMHRKMKKEEIEKIIEQKGAFRKRKEREVILNLLKKEGLTVRRVRKIEKAHLTLYYSAPLFSAVGVYKGEVPIFFLISPHIPLLIFALSMPLPHQLRESISLLLLFSIDQRDLWKYCSQNVKPQIQITWTSGAITPEQREVIANELEDMWQKEGEDEKENTDLYITTPFWELMEDNGRLVAYDRTSGIFSVNYPPTGFGVEFTAPREDRKVTRKLHLVNEWLEKLEKVQTIQKLIEENAKFRKKEEAAFVLHLLNESWRMKWEEPQFRDGLLESSFWVQYGEGAVWMKLDGNPLPVVVAGEDIPPFLFYIDTSLSWEEGREVAKYISLGMEGDVSGFLPPPQIDMDLIDTEEGLKEIWTNPIDNETYEALKLIIDSLPLIIRQGFIIMETQKTIVSHQENEDGGILTVIIPERQGIMYFRVPPIASVEEVKMRMFTTSFLIESLIKKRKEV